MPHGGKLQPVKYPGARADSALTESLQSEHEYKYRILKSKICMVLCRKDESAPSTCSFLSLGDEIAQYQNIIDKKPIGHPVFGQNCSLLRRTKYNSHAISV